MALVDAYPAMVELAERLRVRQLQQVQQNPMERLKEYVGTLFQKQREVLGCSARKVAVLCTRRAGKTHQVPAALFTAAEENPGCVILFIGRTRIRAKQLAWEGLLKANEAYRLGFTVNKSDLTLTHPSNGAQIRLVGADDKLAPEKLRGDKLAKVIIDETQSIPEDVLRTLVEDVLWQALLDVSGQLVLMGTPGYVCSGYWYSLTRNEDEKSRAQRAAGWVVFEWSGLDNTALNHKGQRICDLFAAELAALEADPAKGPTHPSVVREMKGRWATDVGGLFYAFVVERNTYEGVLPRGHEWRKALGVDLGKTFAIEVLAFSPTHPIIYEVDSLKVRESTPSVWLGHVQRFLEEHQPDVAVVDTGGLGAAIVEEWQAEGLPVEPAEKVKRDSYIALLNADLENGKAKAKVGSALAGEWATLPKDPNTPPGKPPQPKPGHDDHSADAALYAWRKARQLAGREDNPTPETGTPEDAALKRQKAMQKHMARRQQWQEDAW